MFAESLSDSDPNTALIFLYIASKLLAMLEAMLESIFSPDAPESVQLSETTHT